MQRDRRAMLRLEHAGRWIAWTADLSRIAVSAADPVEARKKGRAMGIAGLVYERVPPELA